MQRYQDAPMIKPNEIQLHVKPFLPCFRGIKYADFVSDKPIFAEFLFEISRTFLFLAKFMNIVYWGRGGDL